jgi:RND family efflux transporter MFP subunit
MRRNLWILAALAVIVGVAVVGCQALRRATPTANATQQTYTVKKGSLEVSVSSAGSISSHNTADLSFRIAGQVKAVNVTLGDTVQAGDVLMELDTKDLESSIASAQASLNSAEANYRKVAAGPSQDDIKLAKMDLQAAADALQKAQADYDRVSWRPNIGMLPQSSALQQATQAYEKAQITYAQKVQGPNADDLISSQAQVDQAKISLQQAQDKLDQATLVASVNGTVTAVGAKVGDYVNAGGTAVMVSLVDMTSLEIRVPLAETDVTRVAPGQQVLIALDALTGVALTGKVTYVPVVATVSQGVVTYPVTVAVDKSAPNVRVGMTASVRIMIDQRENVLLVSNRAVTTSGRQRTVQVLVQGQTTEVPVTLGATNDTTSEVVSGLNEGDVVVLRAAGTSTQSGSRFIGMPIDAGPAGR